MKLLKFKKLLGCLLLGVILVPQLATATEITVEVGDKDSDTFDIGSILSITTDTDGEGQGQSYLNDESPVVGFILDIVNFITRVIGTIAMILIIVGGLMMIVSQGEEHLLQKGKDVLTTAIFGLVISMFAYIIVRFVQSLFYLPGAS